MLIHNRRVVWSSRHRFYWRHTFGAACLMFAHSYLLLLLVFVSQAVIVRNRLEHIQPDGVWFIFEVSRFELNWIQWVNRTARCRQLGSKSQLSSHITWSATFIASAVNVFLSLIYLCNELVQTFLGLFVANFTQLFALLFRHSDFHFCERSLLCDFAVQDLFLCIHIVIAIEVDRLCSRCSIDHLLLHSFQIKLGLFLLR